MIEAFEHGYSCDICILSLCCLNLDTKARDYKDKLCPYYEDLCIIFGKDRATGKDSKDFVDLEKEANEEEAHDANSSKDELTESSSTQVGASTTSSQNKKARISDKWIKEITEAALILGKDIKAASCEPVRAMSHDLLLSEKQSKINEELLTLKGLTRMERYQAGRKIACNHETTDLFFSIIDEEKEE